MSFLDQIETAAADVLAALDEHLTERRARALRQLQRQLERAAGNFNDLVGLLRQLQIGFEEIARYRVVDMDAFHAVFRTDRALADRIVEDLLPERKRLDDATPRAATPLDQIAVESLRRVTDMVKYTRYGSMAVGYGLMTGALLEAFASGRLASANLAQAAGRVVEIELVSLGASRLALAQGGTSASLQALGTARYLKYLQFAEKVGRIATALSALVSVVVVVHRAINIARMREAMTELGEKVRDIRKDLPALQSSLDGYATHMSDLCTPFLVSDPAGRSWLGNGEEKVDLQLFLADLGRLAGLVLDDGDDGVSFGAQCAEVARQAGLVRRIMVDIHLRRTEQTSRFDNALQAAVRGARLRMADAHLALILGDGRLVGAIRDFAGANPDGTRAVIRLSGSNEFAVVAA